MKELVAMLSAVIVAMISLFFYTRKKNKEVKRANDARLEAENEAYESKMEAEAKAQESAELKIESDMIKAVSNLGRDIHKAVLKKKEQTHEDEKTISSISESTKLSDEEKEAARRLSEDPCKSCD